MIYWNKIKNCRGLKLGYSAQLFVIKAQFRKFLKKILLCDTSWEMRQTVF